MKLVINVPDYIKEQADDGKGEEFGIPLWLAYEIAKGTPLPKGHGRLIDADDIDNHIIGHVDTRSCPTIIEADKVESEDKE